MNILHLFFELNFIPSKKFQADIVHNYLKDIKFITFNQSAYLHPHPEVTPILPIATAIA